MIGRLSGVLLEKSPPQIVVDPNGVLVELVESRASRNLERM